MLVIFLGLLLRRFKNIRHLTEEMNKKHSLSVPACARWLAVLHCFETSQDTETMDGKRQISGKLVPEIMFVQAVRASPFLPQADILKAVLSPFSGENGKEQDVNHVSPCVMYLRNCSININWWRWYCEDYVWGNWFIEVSLRQLYQCDWMFLASFI